MRDTSIYMKAVQERQYLNPRSVLALWLGLAFCAALAWSTKPSDSGRSQNLAYEKRRPTDLTPASCIIQARISMNRGLLIAKEWQAQGLP